MNDDAFKILTGFFIGAIGGLIAGMLIAPDSGDGTRKKISETANKLKHDFSDFADETLEAAKKSISEVADDLLKEGDVKNMETNKK